MNWDSESLEATPCPAITFQPGPTSHFFETPDAERPLPSIEKHASPFQYTPIKEEPSLDDDALHRTACTTLGPIRHVPDVEQAEPPESDPKKLKSIFTFQKGVNGEGQPFFTVSQVVAASGIVFRGLPDLAGTEKALRIAKRQFKEKAVLGALALIDKNGEAHILKTATSANVGPGVDILGSVKTRQLLWQPIWRKRVVKLALMLKVKLGSIYDAAGAKQGCSPEHYGRYHASHVEKKLATFLLYMMLSEYGVELNGKYATCENIRKLKRRIQSDPRRMRFELLVSRKWCATCLAFVRRLSSASSIEMCLRVQPIVEPIAVTSKIHKEYRLGGGEAASQIPSKASPTEPNKAGPMDTAFTDEELQAFGELELEDGEAETEQDMVLHRKIATEKTVDMQTNKVPSLSIRSEFSEPCAPPQNEDGDDLFFPLYDKDPGDESMDVESGSGQEQHDAVPVALTMEEEQELFGSPGPENVTEVGKYGHFEPVVRSRAVSNSGKGDIAEPNQTDCVGDIAFEASPLDVADALSDEDELFVPLGGTYKPPSPESPGEETSEPEAVDSTETPPPPSSAQVAAFARQFAAPFAYQGQAAASSDVRRQKKSVVTARERVFQRKPLPATPVTTEPAALRFGTTQVPQEKHQAVEEYDFTCCDDPVFSQLEMERYG